MKQKYYLLILIIGFFLFCACEKDTSLGTDMVDNQLCGSWQLEYMDDSLVFINSAVIFEMGFMCNFTISDNGFLKVYEGYNHDFELAEWKIIEIAGSDVFSGSITMEVKMRKPDKLKYTYKYSITCFENDQSIYLFKPLVNDNESFVFFNFKNLGNGLPGNFAFHRTE